MGHSLGLSPGMSRQPVRRQRDHFIFPASLDHSCELLWQKPFNCPVTCRFPIRESRDVSSLATGEPFGIQSQLLSPYTA